MVIVLGITGGRLMRDDGDPTVNVVVVVSAGTEPTSLPEATTLPGPVDAEPGIVKAQEKPPVAEVVCEVHVWAAGVLPANVNTPIAVFGEKPDPVTVTEEPPGAEVGLNDSAGVVIVKASEETTALVLGSLTTTRPLLEPLVATDSPAGMPPEPLVVNWSADEQGAAEAVDGS
jgi:hypothetical protein